MNIIITGGAGFIGSNLCDYLYENNKITIIDNLCTGNIKNLPHNVNFIQKDIRKLKTEDFDGVEFVFHCAALARVQPSIKDPVTYHDVNVNGTLNILECCRDAGIKRLIFSSSSSVYGNTDVFPTNENCQTNPISPYGLQKLIGEQYCKLYSHTYGLDTVCLRYFNVYGEKMPTDGAYRTAISIFMKQKLEGLPITVTNDGSQRRDFTYVKDVVMANVYAMNYKDKFNGECINIGSGNNNSINEIAGVFNSNIEYTRCVTEPLVTLADNSKAKLLLGWQPKQNVIEWIKKNYE